MDFVVVSINRSYDMRIPLTGDRAQDREQVATYLRHLAAEVEVGDLDEHLGAVGTAG